MISLFFVFLLFFKFSIWNCPPKMFVVVEFGKSLWTTMYLACWNEIHINEHLNLSTRTHTYTHLFLFHTEMHKCSFSRSLSLSKSLFYYLHGSVFCFFFYQTNRPVVCISFRLFPRNKPHRPIKKHCVLHASDVFVVVFGHFQSYGKVVFSTTKFQQMDNIRTIYK